MGKIITKFAGLFVLFRVFFVRERKKKLKRRLRRRGRHGRFYSCLSVYYVCLEREIGKYDFESFFCVRMMFLDSLFVFLEGIGVNCLSL